MSNLTSLWKAEFKDGSTLSQFDEKGENKYQEVLDRQDELKYFHLHNWSVNTSFTVDLEKGFVYGACCGQRSIPSYLSEEARAIVKTNIRLIYFRRVIITGQINKFKVCESKRTVHYFLGYQYTDQNGHNKKVIFQINDNGDFVIGE